MGKLPETLRQGAKGHMLDQTSGAGTLQRCRERRHCPRPWGIIVLVPGAPLSVSRAPCARVEVRVSGVTALTQVLLCRRGWVWPQTQHCATPPGAAVVGQQGV